jgi:hypothetical protein
MEQWQVIFVSLYGGVLAWLLLTNIQQTRKTAVIETILNQLMKNSDALNLKLDLFLKSEVDTLKAIIEK